jgi:hypothetical protein
LPPGPTVLAILCYPQGITDETKDKITRN